MSQVPKANLIRLTYWLEGGTNTEGVIPSASVSWERSLSRELASSRSETYGWSVTTTLTTGYEGGGASVELGVEVSTNGEYTTESAETQATNDNIAMSTDFEIPIGRILTVTQEVQTG